MGVKQTDLLDDGPRDATAEKVEALLGRMTLEEKLAQLGSCWVFQLTQERAFSPEKAAQALRFGIGQITRVGGASDLPPQACAELANSIQKYLVENTRLGIPAVIHEEACSGYMAPEATCFPQTIGVSCTWEPELVEKMAAVVRDQMRASGAHQALAPLLDVTRDPRWGRVEETYGEDPFLVSAMGTAYVRGMQAGGSAAAVLATGKHFVGYGASEGGMNWAPSHIPARELREVFLHPFEAAVRAAGLASIMNGYHELDGMPCAASKELLTHVLREQWGFAGTVVSDYFAVSMLHGYHNIARDKSEAAAMALQAGIDVELPNTDSYGEPLGAALRAGFVGIAAVDRAVARVLRQKFELGLFDNPYVDEGRAGRSYHTEAQKSLNYDLACKSMVLLKNEGGLLPLARGLRSIVVIGPNADSARNLLGDYSYVSQLENTLDAMSGDNVFDQLMPDTLSADAGLGFDTILQGIRKAAPPQTVVHYAEGCSVTGDSEAGFAEAVEAAKRSEVAVLFVGDRAGLVPACTVGESRDRAEIGLPGVQEKLVRAVAATGTPVVVVLVNGRPFSLPWIDANIPAVLEAWLPGEEGARAVADTLFGLNNPGGKLSISFPRSSGQIPVYYYHKKSGGRSHWRGDYADMSAKPLYPFGHGLSYTGFEYTGLAISPEKVDLRGAVSIRVTIKNIGTCAGDETVQLYVNDPRASLTRPVKELKGFKRVKLGPGEAKTVTFRLSPLQLGFYDESLRYVVEPGEINVMVGASSEDIRLAGSFEIPGSGPVYDAKAFFPEIEVTEGGSDAI